MSPKSVALDLYTSTLLQGIKDSICNVKQICNVDTDQKHFINRHCCQKILSLATCVLVFSHSIKAEVFEVLVLRKHITSDSKPPLQMVPGGKNLSVKASSVLLSMLAADKQC